MHWCFKHCRLFYFLNSQQEHPGLVSLFVWTANSLREFYRKYASPLHCTSPFLIQEACQQLSGNFQNVKYSSDSDFVQGKLLGALLLLSLSVLALGFHPQDVPLLPSILPWNPFLAWVAFSLEYTSHIFYKFHSSTSLLFFYPNPVLLSLPNAEPL